MQGLVFIDPGSVGARPSMRRIAGLDASASRDSCAG
jgi:hypothetical protein